MIPRLLLAALIAAPAGFAGGRITFIKSFPGSVPEYVEIVVDSSGTVAYRESADDDPDKFKLDPDEKAKIFDLAAKLDDFAHPLESGLKVANMGVKTFRWEDGDQKHEQKFNYSLDENAKALQDWFERISETQRLLAALQRAVRHDKLGVNDAVLQVQAEWNLKRLVSPEQFLPLLDQIAKNDIFMHISRERAAILTEAIRAARPKS
jgi:hypothetical protein